MAIPEITNQERQYLSLDEVEFHKEVDDRVRGIATIAITSQDTSNIEYSPVKAVHPCSLQECNHEYREILEGLVGVLEIRHKAFWVLEEEDGISSVTIWFKEASAFIASTRKKLQASCEQWAGLLAARELSFSGLLERMHEDNLEYFALLFHKGNQGLYTSPGEEGLLFSSQALEVGSCIGLLPQDLLSAAVERLLVFPMFTSFMEFLAAPDQISSLQNYVDLFCPVFSQSVLDLSSMTERLTAADREKFVAVCNEHTKEYEKKYTYFVGCPTPEYKEALYRLSREVGVFQESIGGDFLKLKKKNNKFKVLLERLNKGLPKSWPVLIENPFDGLQIVLGAPKELEVRVDARDECFSVDFQEAFDLGYAFGPPPMFLKPVCDFFQLRTEVRKINVLLKKYSDGEQAEKISNNIVGLAVPKWPVVDFSVDNVGSDTL